ncbi:hypothetical protein Tco_0424616 [Tanacetum coccineum]
MTEPTLEEYVNKTRGDYYSGITKMMINGKAAYELKRKISLLICRIRLSAEQMEKTRLSTLKDSLRLLIHSICPTSNNGINFEKYYMPSRIGKIVGTKGKWDSSNVMSENCLALKFTNHMMMDPFTKNALWDY